MRPSLPHILPLECVWKINIIGHPAFMATLHWCIGSIILVYSFLNTGEDRHFPTKQSAICLCAFQAAILCRGAFFFNFEPLSGSTLVSKKGSCFGLKVEEKSCFHKQLPSPVQFWSKVRGNKERFMRAAARTKIQMVNGKEWWRIFASGLYRHLAYAIHALATGIPAFI